MFPEARETKANTNYWDYIKIKTFCTVKKINKTERQPSECEEIFKKDISDKRLVSKVYKELIELNTQKVNNPIKKKDRRYEQTFLQRIKIANRHVNRCSTTLIIREVQIESTRRNRLSPAK